MDGRNPTLARAGRALMVVAAVGLLTAAIAYDDMPTGVFVGGVVLFGLATALVAKGDGELREARVWLAGLAIIALSPLLPGAGLELAAMIVGLLVAIVGSAISRGAFDDEPEEART